MREGDDDGGRGGGGRRAECVCAPPPPAVPALFALLLTALSALPPTPSPLPNRSAIQGAFAAQYEVLRAKGHSPSEAFNETVEEATQSLYPLIGKNGMDWMYANCSTTAQRGALDWWRPFRDATKPVFEKLYASVETGEETRRTLDANSRPTYKADLDKELAEMRNSEMWRAGVAVRGLRPENTPKGK